jgi:hypothetical protein
LEQDAPPSPQTSATRLVVLVLTAFGLALAIAFSVYVLLSGSRVGSHGFGSLWFLALLPAVLCAPICYIGDPDQTRSLAFYWLVPIVLVAVVDFFSAFVLREGAICLIMLSPVWIASGWAGAFLLRSQRRRALRGNALHSSFLIIPLVAGIVEARIPTPHDQVLLTRTILVHATPAEIWPYAVANLSIGPREGRWTITHNIIGLPRPRGTVINGAGVGAVRTAYWGDHINFEERITRWAPGQKLAWRFAFSNTSLQDYTDKHISPDGQFLKIDTGDYTICQISPGTTQVTLNTRYIAMTHVNLYARLWGEFLLGDTVDNILTIIKDRSEAAHAREVGRG